MWVIVYGNPFDGLNLFGPFTDHDEAVEFAEAEFEEWHVVALERP